MFAKSVMIPKEKCIKAEYSASVESAVKLLEEKDVDALPVTDNGQYKGMLNRYIVYRSFYQSDLSKDEFFSKIKMDDVLTKQDVFIQIEDVFEDTFVQLNDFPIIAVVENGKFQGLVTRYDAMNQFRSAFGMDKPGTRISMTSSESEGRIARLGDIIQKYHESVISIVTFDETDKLLRRIVLKIEKRNKLDPFLKELDKSGFRVLHIEDV